MLTDFQKFFHCWTQRLSHHSWKLWNVRV